VESRRRVGSVLWLYEWVSTESINKVMNKTPDPPKLRLTSDEQKEVCDAINAYAWKHSWHLPADHNGYTKWDDHKTLAKCLEVLEQYRRDAIRFAAKLDRLAERIVSIQSERAKDAANE